MISDDSLKRRPGRLGINGNTSTLLWLPQKSSFIVTYLGYILPGDFVSGEKAHVAEGLPYCGCAKAPVEALQALLLERFRDAIERTAVSRLSSPPDFAVLHL